MREIKFKLWDTHLKTMEENAHIYSEFSERLSRERYIPLQYTGLKDKNGTEIYESDVVSWRCRGSIIEGEVYWAEAGWKVKDNRGGNACRLSSASSISVLGNIHEG